MKLDTILYGNVTILDLIEVAVIFILAIGIAKGLTIHLRRSLKERVSKEHLDVILKVIYYGIILLAFLPVLQIHGVQLSSLLVAGGIAGIVLGIASQSVVGNLVSGLFLMIERPMKLGQSVNIAGIAGVIEDISILSTTLRTFEGLYVRIPNEKVFTTEITNYVAHVARRLEYVVGIRYNDDADKAIGIIRNLHEAHPLTLKYPLPDIFVDNLGDNAVNIIVRLWVPSSEWYGVKKELLWKIKTALEAEGIEIAFPQRTVWFANELQMQTQMREKPESSDAAAK
jgi:small-conductance mechanosensitive channel